jgi:hypothetical protein
MTEMLTARATAMIDRKVWRRRVIICFMAMDVSKCPIILDYPSFIGIF